MFFKKFCDLEISRGTQVKKHCFSTVHDEFIQVKAPTLLKFNCMKYLVFILYLLFAKLTFKNYKFLIQRFRISKFLQKEYARFFGVRKISTKNGLLLYMQSERQL